MTLQRQEEYPSDKFLLCIVQHQRCLEDFKTDLTMQDRYATAPSQLSSQGDTMMAVDVMQERMEQLKRTITFPLSDCRMSYTSLLCQLLTRRQ